MQNLNYTTNLEAILMDVLQNHPKEYDTCADVLKGLIQSDFKALMPESNPISANLNDTNKTQLAFVIREYAVFSQEAIHLLLDAMIRNHDWTKLYEEIQENIDEEKGKDTRGIPHLEMMRQGYAQDLGIDTEDVVYSECTQAFLKKMRKIFNNNDNAFSAGALLALEGTAIFEFHILDKIVKTYDKRFASGKVTTTQSTLTNLYIDGHKDFEIGHEAHLREAIRPYINADNIHKLVRGYLSVCMTMNTWWEQLALESQHLAVQEMLKFEDIEVYAVMKAFEKD